MYYLIYPHVVYCRMFDLLKVGVLRINKIATNCTRSLRLAQYDEEGSDFPTYLDGMVSRFVLPNWGERDSYEQCYVYIQTFHEIYQDRWEPNVLDVVSMFFTKVARVVQHVFACDPLYCLDPTFNVLMIDEIRNCVVSYRYSDQAHAVVRDVNKLLDLHAELMVLADA